MASIDEKDRAVAIHAKWSYIDEKILVGLMVLTKFRKETGRPPLFLQRHGMK